MASYKNYLCRTDQFEELVESNTNSVVYEYVVHESGGHELVVHDSVVQESLMYEYILFVSHSFNSRTHAKPYVI